MNMVMGLFHKRWFLKKKKETSILLALCSTVEDLSVYFSLPKLKKKKKKQQQQQQ